MPNTGAGDVVGIFAGASAAGTAAHAVITRRRKN
ncbi:LPXTG cell wall anchor domain-containing protein [Candidatus Saccharibacteria bacterium]|nr:LPXTG cell wall anchor domain-containing protein [Candidatus Saccharibacteria bacterium]